MCAPPSARRRTRQRRTATGRTQRNRLIRAIRRQKHPPLAMTGALLPGTPGGAAENPGKKRKMHTSACVQYREEGVRPAALAPGVPFLLVLPSEEGRRYCHSVGPLPNGGVPSDYCRHRGVCRHRASGVVLAAIVLLLVLIVWDRPPTSARTTPSSARSHARGPWGWAVPTFQPGNKLSAPSFSRTRPSTFATGATGETKGRWHVRLSRTSGTQRGDWGLRPRKPRIFTPTHSRCTVTRSGSSLNTEIPSASSRRGPHACRQDERTLATAWPPVSRDWRSLRLNQRGCPERSRRQTRI